MSAFEERREQLKMLMAQRDELEAEVSHQETGSIDLILTIDINFISRKKILPMNYVAAKSLPE
jgi:hypothetical protein